MNVNDLTSEWLGQVFCKFYHTKNIKKFAFTVIFMKHLFVDNSPFFFRNNKQKCYKMQLSKRVNISQKEPKFIQCFEFLNIKAQSGSADISKWIFVDIWYRVSTKTFFGQNSDHFGFFWKFLALLSFLSKKLLSIQKKGQQFLQWTHSKVLK